MNFLTTGRDTDHDGKYSKATSMIDTTANTGLTALYLTPEVQVAIPGTGGSFTLAGQVPTFLLAPVAGVLVDRWDRRRVLIVTQVLAMIQSAFLAALALAGVITVTHVVILSVFQGLINAFDMPTRQSFTIEMVGRGDLMNAVALNSSMFNGARLLGPI